jgi:hypothetical protein
MELNIGRKKVFLLLASLLFTISLFANSAHAQTDDSFMPEIIEKWAKFLFFDLSDMAKSGSDVFVIYSKFLFFWVVFAVLFWGASKVFGDNKGIAATLAVIISIITVVMIPKSMMIFIYESYSTVISIAFGLLPFIIGLIIGHRALEGDETWKRILRAIIYILMAIITFAFVQTLRGLDDRLYIEMAKWAEVGAFISLIVGIWSLFTSIGSGGGSDSGDGKEGGSKSPWWWPFKGSSEKEKLTEEEKRAQKIVKKEEDIINYAMSINAGSLKNDQEIRNYLQRLKEYAAARYNEFIQRKLEVSRKLVWILRRINDFKKQENNAKKLINRKKRLLNTLKNLLNNTIKDEKKEIEELKKAAKGFPKGAAGKLQEAFKNIQDTERADKATYIENELITALKGEEDKRKSLVNESEKSINAVIKELEKSKPEQKDILARFEYVISKSEAIIKFDDDILTKEKTIWDEDKFIENVLGVVQKRTQATH